MIFIKLVNLVELSRPLALVFVPVFLQLVRADPPTSEALGHDKGQKVFKLAYILVVVVCKTEVGVERHQIVKLFQ